LPDSFYLDQKFENTIQRTFEAMNYRAQFLKQITYPMPREKAAVDVRKGKQDIKEHKASDAGSSTFIPIGRIGRG
jgi:hypothetical protein